MHHWTGDGMDVGPAPDELLSFRVRCPFCDQFAFGEVRRWSCIGGAPEFAGKVTGLVAHRCEHCKRHIGVRLKVRGNVAEPVGPPGEYPKMHLLEMAKLYKDKQRSLMWRRLISRIFGRPFK